MGRQGRELETSGSFEFTSAPDVDSSQHYHLKSKKAGLLTLQTEKTQGGLPDILQLLQVDVELSASRPGVAAAPSSSGNAYGEK